MFKFILAVLLVLVAIDQNGVTLGGLIVVIAAVYIAFGTSK